MSPSAEPENAKTWKYQTQILVKKMPNLKKNTKTAELNTKSLKCKILILI